MSKALQPVAGSSRESIAIAAAAIEHELDTADMRQKLLREALEHLTQAGERLDLLEGGIPRQNRVGVARVAVKGLLKALTPSPTKATAQKKPKGGQTGVGMQCSKCGKQGVNARSHPDHAASKTHKAKSKADTEDDGPAPAALVDRVPKSAAQTPRQETVAPTVPRPGKLPLPAKPITVSVVAPAHGSKAEAERLARITLRAQMKARARSLELGSDESEEEEDPPEEEVEAPKRPFVEADGDDLEIAVRVTSRKVRKRPRRTEPRAKTISMKRLSQAEQAVGALLFALDDMQRPLLREECSGGPRPCPFVSCKYNLYLDVNPDTGSIKLNFPNLEVWEMRETCVLDVADRGGATLEEVGMIINLTRERIRQVEVRGLVKLKLFAAQAGLEE